MHIKDARPGSGPFAMVRRSVLTHPVVTGGEAWGRTWRPMNGATYAVWLCLLSHVGGRHNGWGVTLATIQAETNLSHSSVKRAIRELLDRQLLRRVAQMMPGGGRGSNRWFIQDPPLPTYGKPVEGGPDLTPSPRSDLAPPPGPDSAPFGDVPSETENGNNPPSPPAGGDWVKEERISWLRAKLAEVGVLYLQMGNESALDEPQRHVMYRFWVHLMERPRELAELLRAPAGWNQISPPWGTVRTREVAEAARLALLDVGQMPLI